MSVQLTPSKRPYDRNNAESNGKGKWQKSSTFTSQNSQSKNSPASNVIRVLCPVSRIGSVIGKGGNIISQIRQETGAKVRVEETVPGCDERVIVIAGSDKENEVGSEQGKADGGETDQTEKGDGADTENEGSCEQAKADGGESDKTEKGDDADKYDNNDEDKQSVPVEDSQPDKDKSSVQKALLLVFERMVGETEMDGENENDNKSSSHVLRLIVHSSQVGCLLGKGGSIIKQISSESGAQIRVLPRDKLPLCACSSDELVQISGETDAVRKALQSVCGELLANSGDEETLPTNSDGPSSRYFSRQDTIPQSNHSFHGQGPSFSARSRDGERGFRGRMNPQDVLTFWLLCPDEKVGGVIGKGGNIIKALQHETGCEIKVLESVADSEDRVIGISGPAHPDDRISTVQDGVLRVHSRILRAAPESKEKTITAKILVSSNQIGCLLGKGGAIIAEMRKSSGAYIRILGKEQIPKCAAENEEVVQINGELEAVEEALMQITTRLRDHFFRDAFPSMNHGSNPAFLDQMPPFPSYMGRREFSPPGMYSNLGPTFHKFGGLRPHDDHPPFMHDFHRPGMQPLVPERMPPSAPWGPQRMLEGGGPMGLPDYAGAPQRRIGGFGGRGNHQAIITSTTVEVVVPRSVVPAIYGEDGGCLRQIREISDAKITITEPKPGATETTIIISGTPEQTNAAQSLIQAFVISETEAP